VTGLTGSHARRCQSSGVTGLTGARARRRVETVSKLVDVPVSTRQLDRRSAASCAMDATRSRCTAREFLVQVSSPRLVHSSTMCSAVHGDFTSCATDSHTNIEELRIQNLGRGFARKSGDGSSPLGSTGKAPVGGLWTSPPETGGILQIILQFLYTQ